MRISPISIRLALAILLLSLLGTSAQAAPQTANASLPVPANGYRIAGIAVSKIDAHPLARARITVTDTKDSKKSESFITAEDGRFAFTGVPAGKYSLSGEKREFITGAYDQHDEYATAIVTGAGLDTEHLTLRLAPNAIITGKILDEAGEPVRHANVTLYKDDHSQGVDQIRQFRGATTDDLGEYELTPLPPGTYFLSASAKPWYAVHPRGDSQNPSQDQQAAVDRSLDVAYPGARRRSFAG